MLARLLAGATCAAGLLVAVCTTPAAAHPIDQQVRPTFGSFLGNIFGSSTARMTVNYTGNQKPGTIIISTGQRRLYLVLGNGQALSYGIGVGKEGFA
jgi:lipoprotein-anchoring transpeptidase ErfK/SrfK